MKTILFILQKEFLQIKRNKAMVPIIFVVPIVQLIILVHAATFEMKNIRLVVVDNDYSSTSKRLVEKFQGSPFFIITNRTNSYKLAEEDIKNGDADVVISIPENFEKNLIKENKDKLQLVVNAINGTSAGLINAYSISVINEFNKELGGKNGKPATAIISQKQINIFYECPLAYLKFIFVAYTSN
jgi:ABC-2 type transport system permease protein